MTIQSIHARPATLVVCLLTLSVACGEGPTEHDEEVDIHGMVISDAGTPVVTDDDGVVTGSISVDAGEETADYAFTFLDHDGDPVTSGLSDFTVEATVDDVDVAVFHATSDFEAHFEGISVGSTTVVISLVHAADGDDHYTSPPIDVDVS